MVWIHNSIQLSLTVPESTPGALTALHMVGGETELWSLELNQRRQNGGGGGWWAGI